MVKAVSFFSGAGGLDIGLSQAGIDIKLSVEIDKGYCETLKYNYPSWNVQQGDIMNYDKNKIYEEANLTENEDLDLIVGGSPCQSFSTAGKRTAFSDSRGAAMVKFSELVSEVKPKMFLLENVRGLLSAALIHRPLNKRGKEFPELDDKEKRGSALSFLLSYFKDYNVEYKTLNAADYGVPQKRERVFFVGIRKDLKKIFSFPEPTHKEKVEPGSNKEEWNSVFNILKLSSKINNQQYVNYSAERLKYMRMIPQGGGNWRDLKVYGEHFVKEAMGGAYYSGGGKVGFFRRIKSSAPSPTLLTSPAQKSTNLGHPYEDRPLSVEEYLMIQQFPSGFEVLGTIQQKYIQIGNAVPVGLAEVLGKQLLSFLNKYKEVEV